jgi:hypothetical protein
MRRITNFLLTLGLILPMLVFSTAVNAQAQVETLKKDQDTLKEHVSTLRDKVSGVEERLATAEGDLAKLTKIKISGYIQAQYQYFSAATASPNNLFSVRRARIKFTYEPLDGIVFVLQPDFAPGSLSLKDAFVQLNDRWLKTFSLTAGKFNRPNYEVEYSSSSRELPERTRVIRAIYPDERAIGAKLEIAPQKVPIKVQLAIFNGNDGIGINNPVYNYSTGSWDKVVTTGQNVDFDNFKDFMARITYSFKLGQWGALTVGAHGYYGQIKANSTDLLKSDYTYDKMLDSKNTGKGVKKNWVGFETQFYIDVLGGLALKGEYIFGVNSAPGYNSPSYTSKNNAAGNATISTDLSSTFNSTNDTLTILTLNTTLVNKAPAISRNFMGYYVSLIKNIGKRNQIAVRYDYYNPNTKLSADKIGTAGWNENAKDQAGVANKSTTTAGKNYVIVNKFEAVTKTTNKLSSGADDIPYGTWTFAYSYFFTDNIKIMLAYEMPINTKVGVKTNGVGNVTSDKTFMVNGVPTYLDYSDKVNQNVLTLRLQAKF